MLHEQSRTTESQFTSCIDGIFHTKDNICKMCGSRHRQAVPKPLLWLQLLFFHLFMVGSCWSFVSLLRLFSLVKAQINISDTRWWNICLQLLQDQFVFLTDAETVSDFIQHAYVIGLDPSWIIIIIIRITLYTVYIKDNIFIYSNMQPDRGYQSFRRLSNQVSFLQSCDPNLYGKKC